MKTWSEFLAAIVKGPGWFPGTPRLGDPSFVSERPKREKYSTQVSSYLHLYTLTHFALQFLVTDFIGYASRTNV